MFCRLSTSGNLQYKERLAQGCSAVCLLQIIYNTRNVQLIDVLPFVYTTGSLQYGEKFSSRKFCRLSTTDNLQYQKTFSSRIFCCLSCTDNLHDKKTFSSRMFCHLSTIDNLQYEENVQHMDVLTFIRDMATFESMTYSSSKESRGVLY